MPTQGFKSGPDGRRGRGPKKGAANAGRPNDEHQKQIEALVTSPECLAALEKILKFGAAKDPHLWLKTWCAAWDRIYARPAQEMTLEVSGEVELVPRPPTSTTAEWATLCAASRN